MIRPWSAAFCSPQPVVVDFAMHRQATLGGRPFGSTSGVAGMDASRAEQDYELGALLRVLRAS
jgi:hypothetical protein